jgi:hypothetical protein
MVLVVALIAYYHKHPLPRWMQGLGRRRTARANSMAKLKTRRATHVSAAHASGVVEFGAVPAAVAAVPSNDAWRQNPMQRMQKRPELKLTESKRRFETTPHDATVNGSALAPGNGPSHV